MCVSRRKFQIAREIKFAGCLIGDQEVKPDPELTSAIRNCTAPKDSKEVRRFLGLINQVVSFHPDATHATTGIRSLLKKNVVFNWTDSLEKSFSAPRTFCAARRYVSLLIETCRQF